MKNQEIKIYEISAGITTDARSLGTLREIMERPQDRPYPEPVRTKYIRRAERELEREGLKRELASLTGLPPERLEKLKNNTFFNDSIESLAYVISRESVYPVGITALVRILRTLEA